MLGWCWLLPAVLLGTLAPAAGVERAAAYGDVLTNVDARQPLVLIPGFLSTRLRSVSTTKCPSNPLFGYDRGDPVWIGLDKIVTTPGCFLHCMSLHPDTQDDPTNPPCRVRPDQGMDAISELCPGLLTGPLTVVWKQIVAEALNMGYEPDRTLLAAPYDFRLAPMFLEHRDRFFTRLKASIEIAVDATNKEFARTHPTLGERVAGGSGSVIIAHSMGNQVVLYFFKWIEHTLGKVKGQEWIDKHVHTFILVGAPLLGSPQAVRSALSGMTMGIPIPEHDMRSATTSFTSTPLMLPVPVPTTPGSPARTPHSVLNPRLGKLPVAHIELPNGTIGEYWADDIWNGRIWEDVSAWDSDALKFRRHIDRFYRNDPVLRDGMFLTNRPPVRNVFCTYGINIRSDVGFRFKKGSVADGDWDVSEAFFEEPGGAVTSQHGTAPAASMSSANKAGDESVPYYSLSWCHNWLGPLVNITRVPQRVDHSPDHVLCTLNVDPSTDHEEYAKHLEDHNAFFESVQYHGSRRISTAVWEMDHVDHRLVLQSRTFLDEMHIQLQELSDRQLKLDDVLERIARDMVDSSDAFAHHAAATAPQSDDDCFWDYASVGCMWPTHCEYRYKFGDFHLSQSCRLRQGVVVAAAAGSATVPACACVDSKCYRGFCEYKERCEGAVEAFGEARGWWGPCEGTTKEVSGDAECARGVCVV